MTLIHHQKMMTRIRIMGGKIGANLVIVLLVAAVLFMSTACGKSGGGTAFKIDSEYSAVFLDNGQVFFGKISDVGSDYPLLNDVFYVQTQQNPETKEVRSILIKRGSEWHGPTSMRINSKHVVIIEPVSAESKVAKLIVEAKSKKSEDKEETKK